MRLQLALVALLISSAALAADDKSVNELFGKYDKVMDEKKFELVDDVFTKKFLQDVGGKDAFVKNIKSLPVEKNAPKMKITWKKGTKAHHWFAKPEPVEKSKNHQEAPEFILKKEDGKLKIDGTLSDG